MISSNYLFYEVFTEYRNELLINERLKAQWSLVSEWSENSRYLTGGDPQTVKNFITSVKEVVTWIKKYL